MSEAAVGPGAARPLSPDRVVDLVAALPPGARWLGILTGTRGAGKTTWCASLVRSARAHRLSVAGLLSPAVFAPGDLPPAGRVKLRIDLVDLAAGVVRALARPADPGTEGHAMRWRFDDDTIAWGNAALEAAGAAGGADLVIIDELGPLEFIYDGGLTAGLALLDAGGYRAAVAVIRPELLATALARWPDAEVFTVPAWGRAA